MIFLFELDKFQKETIYHIERVESIFVASLISLGRIVVVIYTFTLVSKHCMCPVYTSFINTISSQKYYDFSNTLDMGLLIGDVRYSLLIMTVEIIGSMFYKVENIIRDIEWFIIDEVHYVNDVE